MARLRTTALLLLALTAQPAGAALIAYESFDYTNVGGDLLGSAGGLGFSGAWKPGGFNASINTNYDVQAGSLASGSLLTAGGSVGTAAQNAISGITRDLASPLGLVDQTVYLSLLVRPEGQLGAGLFQGFFGLTFESPGEPELFVGKPGGGAVNQYVLENRGGAGQVSSGVNAQVGQAALLVVKAQFSAAGNDLFTLYVNPTAGLAEPSTGTVKSGTNVSSVVGLTLYSTGAMRIDELRLGTTFADVTPIMAVPEPASSSLLLGGASLLWLRRRSRRDHPVKP